MWNLRWVFLLGLTLWNITLGLNVVPNEDDLSFAVFDAQGRLLFQGGTVSFFVERSWCVAGSSEKDTSGSVLRQGPLGNRSSTGLLTLDSASEISGSYPGLGGYSGTQWQLTCSYSGRCPHCSVKLIASFLTFKSAVLFQAEWPDGVGGTRIESSLDASSVQFPLFPSPLLPSSLSWSGSFVQSVHSLSTGTKGGPTVFYNKLNASELVVVASPFGGNWKSATAGDGFDWQGRPAYTPGMSGKIRSIPPGFQHAQLLWEGSNSNGITDTMFQWGKVMQQSRHSRGVKIVDITLSKIGYQTDNGAVYCFCREINCSQTLIDEVESLRKVGIPLGYLSFQGAGASMGRGQAAPWCVERWSGDGGSDPAHFPMSLPNFQKALGIPLQLYAPYFCPSSPYFQPPYPWKAVTSNSSLPGCNSFDFQNVQARQSKDFYGWLMDKGVKSDMVSFETDFMNHNYNCVPDWIESVYKADRWLTGMAKAALERNVGIQWCYAAPFDVLASIDHPAVTNFRVSFDFCYGASYNIGESSLLVAALGAAPSKDTLWTTTNNHTIVPGCPWTADHNKDAVELHVILSLLSTGPVGISDGRGYTDVLLVRRMIRSDGTLLKPSRPITAVDSTFLDPAIGGREGLEGHYLYGTNAGDSSWILVSFSMPKSYSVNMSDLWPHLPPWATTIAYRTPDMMCIPGRTTKAGHCVQWIQLPDMNQSDATTTPLLTLPPTPGLTPRITSLYLPCNVRRNHTTSIAGGSHPTFVATGWLFLGELSKYVSLSPQRVTNVICTSSAVHANITGSPGEAVVLTAIRPEDHHVVVQNVTLPPSGSMWVTFSSGDARDTSSMASSSSMI